MLDLYSYLNKRRLERKELKPKVKIVKKKPNNALNEMVWNYLLKNETEYNAYQIYHYHTFLPKPNPKEVDSNEGAIAIYESQRRFMQYKNPMHLPNTPLRHLDLTSAYATVLSGISNSITFFMKHKYTSFKKISNCFKDNLFYIVNIKAWIYYDPIINLYAPNTKIRYNNKPISVYNMPRVGEVVHVDAKLLQSKELNIYGFKYFMDDVYNNLIDVIEKEIIINVYNIVKRPKIFEYERLHQLLQETKLVVDRQTRIDTKIALVTFTGLLLHIDPGMRLIMLGKTEEIIHRFRLKLAQKGAEVEGVQVDAIYYIGPDLSNQYMMGVINQVTGIDVFNYGIDSFVKIEDYTSKDYKETPFRLQEVHNE